MSVLRLADDQLEQLADLIAAKLGPPPADSAAVVRGAIQWNEDELIDAAELAKRIGRSREFVYDNAGALGAIRLGEGPRPRLLFRWPQAVEMLTARSRDVRSKEPGSPVAVAVRATRPRRRSGTGADLLPIGGAARRRSSPRARS